MHAMHVFLLSGFLTLFHIRGGLKQMKQNINLHDKRVEEVFHTAGVMYLLI